MKFAVNHTNGSLVTNLNEKYSSTLIGGSQTGGRSAEKRGPAPGTASPTLLHPLSGRAGDIFHLNARLLPSLW